MKKRQMLSLVLIAMFAVSMNGCSKSASVESVEESEFEEVIVEETFEWPGGDEIPVLECDDGTVLWNNSNGFAVNINGISEEQYVSYVHNCESQGFTLDYDRNNINYFINKEAGYDLCLAYRDDNVYVCLSKIKEAEPVDGVRQELVDVLSEYKEVVDNQTRMSARWDAEYDYIIARYAKIEEEKAFSEAEQNYSDEVDEYVAQQRSGKETEVESVDGVRTEIVKLVNSGDDAINKFVAEYDSFIGAMNLLDQRIDAVDESSPISDIEQTYIDEAFAYWMSTLEKVNSTSVSEMEITESEPSSADGIRPEFKQSMDSYEAFFDEYCAFMTKYRESNNALSMLSDYTEFMKKYTEAMEDLNALEESAMNDAETAYYLEVMTRINQKLLESIQ